MCSNIPKHVFNAAVSNKITPYAAILYGYMAADMEGREKGIYSASSLAELMQCTSRSIRNWIDELQDAELISIRKVGFAFEVKTISPQ